MKKVLYIIAFCLFYGSSVFAQGETIKVKGDEAATFFSKATYKFSYFTPARVHFKNGDISSARFNYDYFKKMMKYIDDNGDTLLIANEEDVEYISTGKDTFFYNNVFLESVSSMGSARLAKTTTYKLIRKEKVGAFGTSSPASNIETRDAILDNSRYQLDINEAMIYSKETEYFLGNLSGQFVSASKKNINKLFPGKNLQEYISKNRLNLNRESDLKELIKYAGN
ncbi:MAG: hypothetical protein ABIN94_20565 [Ferruginibacter sp.]